MKIRHYKESDYREICSWWKKHQEEAPLPGMMVETGTFVVELEGNPVMTLTALFTQSVEVAYLEGYCAKPGLEKRVRNQIGQELWNYVYAWLRALGFKRVVALSPNASLTKRYEELGMSQNMSGLTSLSRSL
jgi:hypothetical protein